MNPGLKLRELTVIGQLRLPLNPLKQRRDELGPNFTLKRDVT